VNEESELPYRGFTLKAEVRAVNLSFSLEMDDINGIEK